MVVKYSFKKGKNQITNTFEMNCYSESSIFSFPINSTENAHDIFEIEKTAAKALKNINLIYEEVMTPTEDTPEDPEFIMNDLVETFESPSYSCDNERHFLKTCCNTMKKLCVTCDRIITECSSCNKCNCRKSDKNATKIKNVDNSDNLENGRATQRPHSAQECEYRSKCTVPKPFSLTVKNEERKKIKEYKISKWKQELEKEIESELKIRAKCKPVPKNTRLPLYNKMVEERQKIKEKRKEKCLEILNNQKPFNLQTSKTMSKAKSSSDLTMEKNTSNFKAKPVPKHILSDKMTEKFKNKEEVRKMLMVERAMQKKEQAASPFSQRPVVPYSRSLIDLLNLQKPCDKEEAKRKNISEITNRLYMKKCNETMENWNKKVMLVDDYKKVSNQENQDLLMNKSMLKKQINKKEELPFMYFPVRMSNAAILRENQIRTEIQAKKERDKRSKEEEIAKKKDNFHISNKLRNLVVSSEGEKEIEIKVKSYRESQIRRKLEYEKELQEIMKRVAEQKLLLEKQSKIKETHPKIMSQTENEADSTEQELTQSEKNDTDDQESVTSNFTEGSSTKS